MKKSENIAELAKALSECQKELQDVYKGTKGYGYNYAPLDKVYDEIRPKSTKHGLSLTHQKSFNRDLNVIELHSMLLHNSGEWIEYYGSLPFAQMKQMNDYQAAGSGFTYIERYQTCAIFGITSDEDQDAQGEQEQTKAVKISQQDVALIKELLIGTKTNEGTLLENYRVKSISELSQVNATDAIQRLQKRKG